VESSDYTLAKRAANGDVHAFQKLFLRHNHRVYSMCLRMTANTAESEDLAQEVFVKVLRYVGGFRGASAFKAWLLRVTSNHVLMHFHKHQRRLEQLTEGGEMPV
jgi:RNA polymerase sigma-70 factor, ECF subfamily